MYELRILCMYMSHLHVHVSGWGSSHGDKSAGRSTNPYLTLCGSACCYVGISKLFSILVKIFQFMHSETYLRNSIIAKRCQILYSYGMMGFCAQRNRFIG